MNYSNIYTQLIDHAKSRKLSRKDCYIEQHHIIPRAEGGTDDKSNLVNLTAREHYIAHLLLAKIYNDAAMYSAVIYMQAGHGENRKYKFNSHLYAKMRIEFGNRTSKEQKGRQAGKNNPMYGRSIFDFMTPEKIKQWRKNLLDACKKRRGLPGSMKGKHHTEESKKHISESMSRLKWWNNGIVSVRCESCPDGFVHGRLKLTDEWKQHISESERGNKHPWYGRHHTEDSKKKISIMITQRNIHNHWYNDGKKNVFTKECPDGFVKGRIYKRLK